MPTIICSHCGDQCGEEKYVEKELQQSGTHLLSWYRASTADLGRSYQVEMIESRHKHAQV